MRASEEFFHGYVTCALWASTDNADDTGGEPLDRNYTIDDISPDCLERMQQDCDAFCESEELNVLLYTVELPANEWHQDERAGHDFWLTQNGHGTGFWDRGLGELGRRLTDASKKYGTFDLYVGDDGLIHC